MKRHWIATGLAALGLGLSVTGAIAQSHMNNGSLNTQMRQALCSQNWTKALNVVDEMKRISPGDRAQLDPFRTRLVLLRDNNASIPAWPSPDYCSGAVERATFPNVPVTQTQTPATTNTTTTDQPSGFSLSATSQPVAMEETNLYRKATIHLDSPDTVLALKMADANSSTARQSFSAFVNGNYATLVASGSYAAGTNWPLKSVGNFIGGTQKYAQYSTGTVLGLGRGNVPEMRTIKKDGTPPWDNYSFALTAGPRLLKNGQVLPWSPSEEGFADPKVTNTEISLTRSSIGFSGDGRKLYYVAFKQDVSLRRAAQVMKDLGCVEAMNLDGGATQAFARNGNIVVNSSRSQTHVLVVYDVNRPAPTAFREALERFNNP